MSDVYYKVGRNVSAAKKVCYSDKPDVNDIKLSPNLRQSALGLQTIYASSITLKMNKLRLSVLESVLVQAGIVPLSVRTVQNTLVLSLSENTVIGENRVPFLAL